MASLSFSRPLLTGTLIRRFKRFLVQVKLRNGHRVLAHTPNTGSMAGCSAPGSRVYISRADMRTGRRLRYTLELVRANGTLVGVNTLVPNRLVRQSVLDGSIPELAAYGRLRSEVKVGHSRIDLALGREPRLCFVEIKNVTLVEDGVACFPDAVTVRGRRHLEELRRLAAGGQRAVVFFLVQRGDCDRMRPADAIDPEYGRTLRRVVAGGVEALVYQAVVSPRAIAIGRRIPLEL